MLLDCLSIASDCFRLLPECLQVVTEGGLSFTPPPHSPLCSFTPPLPSLPHSQVVVEGDRPALGGLAMGDVGAALNDYPCGGDRVTRQWLSKPEVCDLPRAPTSSHDLPRSPTISHGDDSTSRGVRSLTSSHDLACMQVAAALHVTLNTGGMRYQKVRSPLTSPDLP